MNLNHPTPQNVRSSGPLVIGNAGNGVAIFTGYDLQPGDVRSGRVTIANTGADPGRIRLTETEASNNFSAGELTLIIDDITDHHPVAVFAGEIDGMPDEGIDLGCLEPGESRRFRFLVMLDLNVSNTDQSRGAGAVYEWNFAPEGEAGRVSCASFRRDR
jgi:hypothetical protein